MNDLLINLYEKKSGTSNREGYGAFAGTIGLFCNLVLFAFKLAVGLLSTSVSIIADAVNNLSDAGASIVTLLGFKLAQKPADKEHPYGHSRIEYMTGAIIALAIILLGVELFKSSINKIISPEAVQLSLITVIVLALAVVVKLWMMVFYKKVAKKIDSTTLVAAADDSRNDVIMTFSVLIASVVQFAFNFKVDGWVGAGVAVFILISGIGVLKNALSPLLGEAPSAELVKKLDDTIMIYEGVIGIHDLMIHSYGPTRKFATVHVEMSATDDPLHSHGVLDHIERDIEKKFGVKLVIHLDPVVTDDEEYIELREKLSLGITNIDSTLSIHDLRIARTHDHTNLFFDIAVPCSYHGDDEQLVRFVKQMINEINPSYYAVMEIDHNYQSSLD